MCFLRRRRASGFLPRWWCARRGNKLGKAAALPYQFMVGRCQGVKLAGFLREDVRAGFMPIGAVSSRASFLEGHRERDSPDGSGEC